MTWLRRLLTAAIVLAPYGGHVTAMPAEIPPADDIAHALYNISGPFPDFPPILNVREDDEDMELRILPLGASIMSGQGSPEHSGLRKWLRMALRHDGWPVNMVGTRQDGSDMVDKDHEATPGAILTEIQGYARRSHGYNPNIVLINGGTNNANWDKDVNLAYEQMELILNQFWERDQTKNTCIILSTLLPTEVKKGSLNRVGMNGQFRKLVVDYKAKGKCIYLADMEPVGEGSNFLGLGEDIWADSPKVHPNNEGHRRMAYVFYAAIHRALAAGDVKPAVEKESEANTGCDKKYGTGIYAGAKTQKGWGHHDGIYKHTSENKGVIIEMDSEWDRNQWRFARLFSRDYDDMVGWFEHSKNDHRFGVWKNSADGKGNFKKIKDLTPGFYCIPRGLHFIDMNADGLDDIVCIHPNGDLYASINEGNGSGDKGPSFKYLGLVKKSEGTQGKIRLADIDGDGRADYGVIQNNGDVAFWRNGWVNDKPKYWQPLGIRSTMRPHTGTGSSWPGLRFEDINGDGRDDWMYLTVTGQTFTYTNTRSCKQGREGDGLNVAWRQGFQKGKTSGYTHYGMHDFHDSEDNWDLREQIHFARIFGRKPALGNLGVQDYVFIEREKKGKNKFHFKVRVWKNVGQGGTKLIADGDKYCNMIGHDDGREDYVWTWSTGKMHIFPNAGKKFIKGSESFWGPETVMWTPPSNMDRRDLHLTDWDGDGDCDIVYVNPKGGNVRVWINDYPKKKTWRGAFREIGDPGLSCSETRGIGIHDLAVRFADISGNGRADYLCIQPDGHIRGDVQGDDGSFKFHKQIKFAENKDRANLRFADVNGDGKDDLVWTNKFSGDGYVWYNHGQKDIGGSSFHWVKVNKPVYQGSNAGSCMYYPDLDGNGRADMHAILGTWTNEAETWYNPSCGLDDVQGDDPDQGDPKLPEQPGNSIDGPGPGEGDSECSNTEPHLPWRDIECDHPLIKSHTSGTSEEERWEGLLIPEAWKSVLDYWQCRIANQDKVTIDDGFPDIVSDFFNGPPDFFCDIWNVDTNSCDVGVQCHDTNEAQGHFILNSLARIHKIHWSIWDAIADAALFNDVYEISSQYGTKASDEKIAPQIIMDIVMIGFGLFAAPAWNKGFVPNHKNWGSTIKDEVNDLIKNGMTLGKDIFSHNTKAGSPDQVPILLEESMKEMAKAWRESTAAVNRQLFDGSAESITRLTNIIDKGNMIGRRSAEDTDMSYLGADMKRVLNAMLIPQAWSLSSSELYPVLIREDLGCNKSPDIDWTDVGWVAGDAYKERVCIGDASYWLLAPEKYQSTCANDGEAKSPECSAWELPPGFDHLKNGTQGTHGVTVGHIVEGSIKSWEANGRQNGERMSDMTSEWLNAVTEDIDNNLKMPGVFMIPVCDMDTAREVWEKAYNGAKRGPHFPCD